MLKLYRPHEAGFGGQNADSWDLTWADVSLEAALRWAPISHLRPVFDRYFPRDGRILEGGCGLGHFLIYYRGRGYDVEGVDFSPAAVARLKAVDPELPVRLGNVSALPYPAGSFDCYYSGGVVEHFEDGPMRALAEARRVLSADGTLIITVPFLNPIRRLTGLRGRRRAPVGDLGILRREFVVEAVPDPRLQFSEYRFTLREFADLLRRAGFRIVEARPFDVEWGEICQAVHRLVRPPSGQAAAERTPGAAAEDGATSGRLRRLWKELFVSEDRSTRGRRMLLDVLAAVSGHMLLFVCRPERTA